MIQFKKLSDNAIIPERKTPGASAFDLYCSQFAEIKPGAHALIPTGISMAIPPGWGGFIWPRSGLATRHGVDVLAGLIDFDYRGEVMVSLINHGLETVEFKPGDRIAQIAFTPCMTNCVEVPTLDDTQRGAGGFGHTGY